MLAAAQRVRRRADFAAAIRGGRRAGRGALVVHLVSPEPAVVSTSTEPAPAVEAPLPARAGFVVPKTVGNAVIRNLVRRRLRHLVRERLANLPAGSMAVIRVLPGAADLSYVELGEQLDGALDAASRPRHRGRR